MEDFPSTKRFEPVARLGEGGAGVVFQVVDRLHGGQRCAMKVLRETRPDSLLRFKNEFRALQEIYHPNLVSLGELFEEEGRWYYTMEFVDGVDVLSHMRPGHATSAATVSAVGTIPDAALGGGELSDTTSERIADLDTERIRDAIRQLARGLLALHRARMVHRDIKPSNVLVSAEGRVVLVDFGLVQDLAAPTASGTAGGGTVPYMAPEQVNRVSVGSAADLYAVGVVLYEALTGVLPFRGSPADVLRGKQVQDPHPPRVVNPDVPADLDELCMLLMHRDPFCRPTALDVLERISERERERPPPASAPAVSSPLLGRQDELDTLQRAYQESLAGRAVAVLLMGESGIGKTALLHRFLASLEGERTAPLVLAGTCYERELIAYKALDSIAYRLGEHLERGEDADVVDDLGEEARVLATAFPAIRRGLGRGGSHRPQLPSDAVERRAAIMAAVRRFMGLLGRKRPLVFGIDDLQWADADSLSLLQELLREPDPPALLLVATVRTTPGDLTPLAFDPGVPMDLRHVFLEGLGRQEIDQLVDHLLGTEIVPEPRYYERVAGATGGNPMRITERIGHDLDVGTAGEPGTDVELLGERIARLSSPERALLELLCTAEMPLRTDVAQRCSGATTAAFEHSLDRLRLSNLVRVSHTGGSATIEPFHSRVHETVRASLAEEAIRSWYHRIATEIEGDEQVDPALLALHWHGAGEGRRAAEHALVAGDRSFASLSLHQASHLYDMALRFGELAPAERVALLRKRGDALRGAGHCALSADAYLEAADAAPPAEQPQLRRMAAEQYLIGCDLRGLEVLDMVLRPLRMRLAGSALQAFLSILLRRALLRIRGLRYRERAEAEVPRPLLERIDACWAVARGLMMIDSQRAIDFLTRHMALALRAGEPSRIARSFSLEATTLAAFGTSAAPRAMALVKMSRDLAERTRDPYIPALVELNAGTVAYFVGRWREATDHFREALRLLRDCDPGMSWELTTAHSMGLYAHYYMGEIIELVRRIPLLMADARLRGDLFAAIALAPVATFVALARDDVATARREISRARASWRVGGFRVQDYWLLFGQLLVDLACGDGVAALARLQVGWRGLRRSLLLRSQLIRVQMLALRGRSAVAAAVLQDGAQRRSLLRMAERDARKLDRESLPHAHPDALLLRAAVAHQTGGPELALPLLAEAQEAFRRIDMGFHTEVVARCRGALEGGEQGAARVRAAHEYMARQQVRNPDLMVAIHAPGLEPR